MQLFVLSQGLEIHFGWKPSLHSQLRYVTRRLLSSCLAPSWMIYDQKCARQLADGKVSMSTGKGGQKCEVKGQFCRKCKMATYRRAGTVDSSEDGGDGAGPQEKGSQLLPGWIWQWEWTVRGEQQGSHRGDGKCGRTIWGRKSEASHEPESNKDEH